MRQTTFLAAPVSLFATLTFAAGTALAQSTPAPAQAAPAHAHQQGMDHGGQQMHDQMMKDHPQGMQSMTMPPADGAAAKPAMKDCCEGDAMKPKDGAMPKTKDGAMPMKHM